MLLILAVVAISSVSESGIIGQAKNAQSAFNRAQINEQAELENYERHIKNINKRYYAGNLGSSEAVVVYNGEDDFSIYKKENGEFVYLGSAVESGSAKVNSTAIVKFDDEEIECDVVFLSKRAEGDYREDDFIIDGIHYFASDTFFMSANIFLQDPTIKTITYDESDGKLHIEIDGTIANNSYVWGLYEGDKSQFN